MSPHALSCCAYCRRTVTMACIPLQWSWSSLSLSTQMSQVGPTVCTAVTHTHTHVRMLWGKAMLSVWCDWPRCLVCDLSVLVFMWLHTSQFHPRAPRNTQAYTLISCYHSRDTVLSLLCSVQVPQSHEGPHKRVCRLFWVREFVSLSAEAGWCHL